MKITVVGAGYVGLPLGLLLAQTHEVVFLDSSIDKVNLLNQKISPLAEKEVQDFIKKVEYLATINPQEAYMGADYVIISVPTDYEENIGLNTHLVESVIQDAIANNPKATIVIKSTVSVGFTQKIREKLNIENLIFSPEFSREGLALHDCLYPSRIIVGDEAKQSNAFAQLLKDICANEDVPVLLMASSEAEAVKLFSNTYLAMRVSFFNELDSYAVQKGLNTLNVISGVELDPRIGSTYNNPSFGFGGYCLPKDSKELSVSYGLLPKDLIGSINESNQNRINFIVEDILRKNPKVIGIYRLQMKRDSDNLRNSPVIGVLKGLLAAGASVLIYAPLLKEEKFLNSPVLKDLSEFKQRADLIVANRLDDDLSDVMHKIYSRDIKQGGNLRMIKVNPVILCGGSGTRLWPLSRSGFPKQFLVLTGATSLFQQAVERVNNLSGEDITVGPTLVVTNEEHRFLALDQLRELSHIQASLLLEPVARNTAPALTMAALESIAHGDDPVLVVTPADQTIQNAEVFKETLQRAIRVAVNGSIVTLGITPNRPETGYGYIRREGSAGAFGEYAVAQFVEKPNQETAEKYLTDGHFLWNGGMFVLRASVWLEALKQMRSDIASSCEKAWGMKKVNLPFIRIDQESFINVPSESIDYAVMEKCPSLGLPIKMLSLNVGWNDLGAWDAVWEMSNVDSSGNATFGDVILKDSKNTFVHANNRLVAGVGLQDVVIVETSDAVLVAEKSQAQNVKKIVLELEVNQREEKDIHRKVHRPWGWYDSIQEGDGFKVKRILVKPGASLSLQMHHHRAEHWIVVKGIAEITNGTELIILEENQSTYIPKGQLHRLANPSTDVLEIIEVQSGNYLSEDDIIRFEDTYGRAS